MKNANWACAKDVFPSLPWGAHDHRPTHTLPRRGKIGQPTFYLCWIKVTRGSRVLRPSWHNCLVLGAKTEHNNTCCKGSLFHSPGVIFGLTAGIEGGTSPESVIKESIVWRCLKQAWLTTCLPGTSLRHSTTILSKTRPSPLASPLHCGTPFLFA